MCPQAILPDIPPQGVRVSCLRQLLHKAAQLGVHSEGCAAAPRLLDIVSHSKSPQLTDAVGVQPHNLGPATALVISSWHASPQDLLLAIESAFPDGESTFIWWDLLCLGACESPDNVAEVSARMLAALRAVPRHLLFVDQGMLCLEDHWCQLQVMLALQDSRERLLVAQGQPASVTKGGRLANSSVCLEVLHAPSTLHLHQVAEAVEQVTVASAKPLCPRWPRTLASFATSATQHTDHALQQTLWTAIEAAASNAAKMDDEGGLQLAYSKYALGVVHCGKHKFCDAEAALRVAAAEFDLLTPGTSEGSLHATETGPEVSSATSADLTSADLNLSLTLTDITDFHMMHPLPVSSRRQSISTDQPLSSRSEYTTCLLTPVTFPNGQCMAVQHVRLRVSYMLALALYHQGVGFTREFSTMPSLSGPHCGNRFWSSSDVPPPRYKSAAERSEASSKLREAQRLLGQVRDALEASNDASAATQLWLADVEEALGRCHQLLYSAQRGVKCHGRAMSLRMRHLPPGHAHVGHAHLNLGLALSALQVYSDAAPHFDAALNIFKAAHGQQDAMLFATLRALACSSASSGDNALAHTLFTDALHFASEHFGEDSLQTASVLAEFGSLVPSAAGVDRLSACLHLRARCLHMAHPLVEEALHMLLAALSANHRSVEAAELRRQWTMAQEALL